MSVSLEPLLPSDIPRALQIIGAHDEDDAEGARATYEHSLEGQFCLRSGGSLIGVTGFSYEDFGASWLSWHYVAPEFQGKGWGEIMLRQIMVKVAENPVRKMFISTSDYRESIGAPLLYGKAMALYESVGFTREVYHPDYYEQGEGIIIYGQRVRPPQPMNVSQEQVAIALTGYGLIDETESAYFLEWEECSPDEASTPEELSALVESIQREGATAIFVNLPTTFVDSCSALFLSSGFQEEGLLNDYYADGVHEIRYRLNP